MERGDVEALQRALQALLPQAIFANDPANRTLVATATPEQHERIAITVKQMDRANPQEPVLQAYSITKADLPSVMATLTQMYDGNRQVAITADPTNRSLLVKAPARDQQTVAQIVARIENGAFGRAERTLAVYPTDSTDPEATLATFQTLLQNQQPSVDLSLNERTRQLVAVATPSQHAILAEATRQLQSDPQVVEVFSLQVADPFAVETAIDRLYENETSRPLANGDTETQQLFVRGTPEQLEEVRTLLAKMGEIPSQESSAQRGVRVIPFRGDVNAAAEQLKDIWPQLRSNRIQIVEPATPQPILRPALPPVETLQPGGDPPSSPPPAGPDAERGNSADTRSRTRTLPTAGQQATADATPQPQSSDSRPAAPPLMIIPGPGSLTLLSDDEAALKSGRGAVAHVGKAEPIGRRVRQFCRLLAA